MIKRTTLGHGQTRVHRIFEVILSLFVAFPAVAQAQNASSHVEEVRAHGAKCDGSNNDTAAIQSALDALRATGGGTLPIPPNATCLAAGLLVSSNVEIKGAGLASIVKAPANSTAACIFTNIDGRRSNSIGSNITISDLTIDGNRANIPGAYVCGIDITGSNVETGTKIIISKVSFKSFKLNAVNIHANAITAPYPHNITIDHSEFSEMAESCVYIIDANDIEINHNKFSDWDTMSTGKYDCVGGWTDRDTHGLKITDNSFFNTHGTLFAIENVASESGNHFYNVDILRNHFDGGNNNGGSGLSMTGTNFHIENNVWENGRGTQRNGIEASGSQVRIADNVIRGGLIAFTGTKYGKSNDGVLEGNKVYNRNQSNGSCFQLAAINRLRLANNYCDLSGCTGSTAAYKIGIYGIKGVLTDADILGNTAVSNNTATGEAFVLVAAPGSRNIHIQDNRASGFRVGYRDAADAAHDEVTVSRNNLCGNSIPLQHEAKGGHYSIQENMTAKSGCAPLK